MTPESVMTLGQKAMEVTLMVSAPMLLVALATGLLVSIFQAATQINEMTVTFIPKLIVMFVILLTLLPWLIHQLVVMMQNDMYNLPSYIK